MQRQTNVNISSSIVFLSIVTILVEFVLYYFFASVFLILGVSSIILFICCHVLLERASTYEVCFIYALLNIFISLIITILTYFEKDSALSILTYRNTLIGIVILNWLIPTFHCFIRYMFDYGTRVENYVQFYRNNSIVLIIFYLGAIVYVTFFATAFPWELPGRTEINLLPFDLISTQIEDYLDGFIPITDILIYLASRILIFVPFGYYIAIITRRQSRILRFILLLSVPFVLELIQYFIAPDRCDIDDIICAFLGGLLGVICFVLMNTIFRAISGKDFLMKETGYHFSNHSLHF